MTEGKPYVNTRRLSFGEQMTWRFGGWKPMVTTATGLRSDDLSGPGSLTNVNSNSNISSSNSNNNYINSQPNHANVNLYNSNSNVIQSTNTNLNNQTTSANGAAINVNGPSNNGNTNNLSNQKNNQIGLSSASPSSSGPLKSSSSSPVTLHPVSTSSGSSLPSSSPSATLGSPESSESHLAPKFRHMMDYEQVKMNDYMGKGFPGAPGPLSGMSTHGFYGPPMSYSFGKSTFGFPGGLGFPGSKGSSPFKATHSSSLLLPGHLSYLGRGLPVPGANLGPLPTRYEMEIPGKPVKDAELHAYQVIKQLKERGRDIRKDFGVVDAFPVSQGLYPKVTTGENGKRFVTVPVAVETDHDKVLTQNDIKDIEKEVLKIIPEVDHGLVEGAVKDGARVIELRPEAGNGGPSEKGRPSITVTSPSSAGRLPGHPSVITGYSPIIYDNLAANPIKSRISSIFRPLLSKFRTPGHSQSPSPYTASDPKNLNVIHLIAHQDRLPSIVPVDRLVQNAKKSGNSNNNQPHHHHQQQQPSQDQQRYPVMGHEPSSNPPMTNLQYKIIHPPHVNNQGQSGKPSFIEYNPHSNSPGHLTGHHQSSSPQQPSPQSPPYQVIEVPRGPDGAPELIETPPQVVPISGEQLIDLKANQYNAGEEQPRPDYSPSYEQGPTPGSVEYNGRPTAGDYTDHSPSPYPTTGTPGSNYDGPSNGYTEDRNKYLSNDNGGSGNPEQSPPEGYEESNRQPEGNYGNNGGVNEHPSTDYPNPVGPEYSLNAHSGQIERPVKEYPSEGGADDNHEEERENQENPRPTLTPSVNYAEAPKIELLNGGASPDFSPKPFTTPSEYDTKTLINLISNQIPSLGNVLKDSDSKEPTDQSGNGASQNNFDESNRNREGYNNINNDHHGNHDGPGSDQGRGNSPSHQASYEGPANGDGGYSNQGGGNNDAPESNAERQGYGSPGYPRESFTEASDPDQEAPRFGDRIRGQEVIYAKAEHYDDQDYRSNSHSSSGLYTDSSNSREVRVKSHLANRTHSNDGSKLEAHNAGETFTFIKLDSRNKPINGKVVIGSRSTNGSTDGLETSESARMYHAYHGSADHVPPPGYVKLTSKEFKELFKDADIHYSKEDDESSEPLASSISEVASATVATTTSSTTTGVERSEAKTNEQKGSDSLTSGDPTHQPNDSFSLNEKN